MWQQCTCDMGKGVQNVGAARGWLWMQPTEGQTRQGHNGRHNNCLAGGRLEAATQATETPHGSQWHDKQGIRVCALSGHVAALPLNHPTRRGQLGQGKDVWSSGMGGIGGRRVACRNCHRQSRTCSPVAFTRPLYTSPYVPSPIFSCLEYLLWSSSDAADMGAAQAGSRHAVFRGVGAARWSCPL